MHELFYATTRQDVLLAAIVEQLCGATLTVVRQLSEAVRLLSSMIRWQTRLPQCSNEQTNTDNNNYGK